LTVASLATTTASRPAMRPNPVTTPAEVVGHEQADLLKVRVLIEQEANSFASGQLAFFMFSCDALRAAAFAQSLFEGFDFSDKIFKVLAVRGGGLSVHIKDS